MPKILVCDTYYPDFLKTFQVNAKSTYEAELRRLLDRQFGTFDAYSRNLRKLGWEAIDIIANCWPLQRLWLDENGHKGNNYISLQQVLFQIETFKPDVVFMQDLSFFDASWLKHISERHVLAGQLSCQWPGDERVKQFDVLFTSFPHYVPRIEKLGVRAVYNPLAFEPSVADTCFMDMWPVVPTESVLMDFGRIHDCVFIGGVGNPSHWRYGMEVLRAVACDIAEFKWWGYGITGQMYSGFHVTYQGQAWGSDMYSILLRSKIGLNRHGEVAEGYSNNMRMFEATGCGALLLTEESKNIRDFFTEKECVTYSSPQDAVDKIRYYLDHEDERAEIAANGQARTLRDHTYEKRMATVSTTLQEMLCPA